MTAQFIVSVLAGVWATQALLMIWLVDSADARAVMSLIGFVAVLVALTVTGAMS